VQDPARAAFISAVLPNLVHPDDVLPWVDVAFGGAPEPEADAANIIALADRRLFQAAADAADNNDFAALVAAAKAATGLKGPSLYTPLRAALTGRLSGPELGPLLKAMPPGSARARLTRYA
jgi:glutamyl-tRNA synthetase